MNEYLSHVKDFMTDKPSTATQFLRVKADKVAMLLDLVGELSVASTGVIHHPELNGLNLDEFSNSAYHLETLIREVQGIASELRLVSLDNIFLKMKRLVRDLEKQTGKPLELAMSGENTEVDKVVADNLGDPLMHLLRNSADHGIESPEERRLAGKPEQGTIRLSASQSGGEIRIEVGDDGRGLSREKILKKARQLGLVAPDEEPADEEVWKLILSSGFSTAKEISGLSGRGVGMDVVESSIKALRGHLSIKTEAGKGTTMVFHIPLSLAFMNAMIVRLGRTVYAIPIEAIRETVIPGRSQVVRSTADNARILVLRDELLPIRDLRRFFDIDSEATPFDQFDRQQEKSADSGLLPLIVIQNSEGLFALPVEEILGQQQITVKPMTGIVKKIRAGAGWGLLGSGQTALILNVEKLNKNDPAGRK